MRIDIISIFPEYFAPLDVSLIGKARQRGVLDVRVHDLRQWAYDRHRTVDDTPYGGGPGMVMKPEPWGEALDTVAPPSPRTPGCGSGSGSGSSSGSSSGSGSGSGSGAGVPPRLVIPTPSGRPFTQAQAVAYAAEPWLIFGCGRYEGIDSRVVEEARTRMPVDEVSIGDYVLAGGEAAVLVMIEAIGRLLPGVLGNAESAVDDSFAPGRMETLLEGPIYTKPPVWRERAVPEILFSGHHAQIARWRRDEALRRTAAHRPELLEHLDPQALDARDREVLDETRAAES
jgi:tRNA (guanine37-N1)-methyltransferase